MRVFSNAGPPMLMAPEPTDPGSGGAPPADPIVDPVIDPVAPTTPAPVVAAPQPPSPDGKAVTIHTREFKRIKDEAAAKGEKRALEALAKELGFNTPDEIKAFIAKARQKPQNPPRAAAAPQPGGDRKTRELQQQLDAERKQRVAAQKRAKQVEAELTQAQAHAEIRDQARMRGAIDPDFIIHLIETKTKALAQGKTAEEIEKALSEFDEGKFIDDLKKERPHLFGGPEVRLANTGPGSAGDSAAPPKPNHVNRDLANGAAFDAMKAKPEEWRQKYGHLLNGGGE